MRESVELFDSTFCIGDHLCISNLGVVTITDDMPDCSVFRGTLEDGTVKTFFKNEWKANFDSDESKFDPKFDEVEVDSYIHSINFEFREKDNVNPDHYKGDDVQPIDLIDSMGLGFCEGSIIKYVSRYKKKNGLEDLKKAQWYLDFLIKNYEDK